MKRDCSTCICKEGSCYPSTTIFDKDKTCKSYSPDYEGYIAELEKENAELKRHIKADCIDCADYYKNKRLEKENAKAKEIITRFVMASVYLNGKEADLVEEAEQFLNSEVEK